MSESVQDICAALRDQQSHAQTNVKRLLGQTESQLEQAVRLLRRMKEPPYTAIRLLNQARDQLANVEHGWLGDYLRASEQLQLRITTT